MSEEQGSAGVGIFEKFFGLIMMIVGALVTYYTFTSFDVLSAFGGLFGFMSIMLFAVGLILLIARTEE